MKTIHQQLSISLCPSQSFSRWCTGGEMLARTQENRIEKDSLYSKGRVAHYSMLTAHLVGTNKDHFITITVTVLLTTAKKDQLSPLISRLTHPILYSSYLTSQPLPQSSLFILKSTPCNKKKWLFNKLSSPFQYKSNTYSNFQRSSKNILLYIIQYALPPGVTSK